MAVVYNTDFKIKVIQNGSTKATLALNVNGDLQLVNGQDKLHGELIRSVINDNAKFMNVSTTSDREVRALLFTILKRFKNSQIDEINSVNETIIGYHIYRKLSGTTDNYVKITTVPIIWSYTDSSVTNGISYEYQTKQVSSGNLEYDFSEHFIVTPTSNIENKKYAIGTNAVVYNGSNSVNFYFESVKNFKGSELIDNITDIFASPNETDPRRYVVQIILVDGVGNEVSVATQGFGLNIG